MHGGNSSRKIYFARFTVVQTNNYTQKEAALLAIPETCTSKIITLCHSSLFVEYQGVIKTYLTTGDKFFIPGLIHFLRWYIKRCHLCQLSRNDKPPVW